MFMLICTVQRTSLLSVSPHWNLASGRWSLKAVKQFWLSHRSNPSGSGSLTRIRLARRSVKDREAFIMMSVEAHRE